MSRARISRACAKQSATSSAGTNGSKAAAHLYRSMPACRQPGCSSSGWLARVGRARCAAPRAGVKNRKASMWVQRSGACSTTASVPALPSRSGQTAVPHLVGVQAVDHGPLVQPEAAVLTAAGTAVAQQSRRTVAQPAPRCGEAAGPGRRVDATRPSAR